MKVKIHSLIVFSGFLYKLHFKVIFKFVAMTLRTKVSSWMCQGDGRHQRSVTRAL